MTLRRADWRAEGEDAPAWMRGLRVSAGQVFSCYLHVLLDPLVKYALRPGWQHITRRGPPPVVARRRPGHHRIRCSVFGRVCASEVAIGVGKSLGISRTRRQRLRERARKKSRRAPVAVPAHSSERPVAALSTTGTHGQKITSHASRHVKNSGPGSRALPLMMQSTRAEG